MFLTSILKACKSLVFPFCSCKPIYPFAPFWPGGPALPGGPLTPFSAWLGRTDELAARVRSSSHTVSWRHCCSADRTTREKIMNALIMFSHNVSGWSSEKRASHLKQNQITWNSLKKLLLIKRCDPLHIFHVSTASEIGYSNTLLHSLYLSRTSKLDCFKCSAIFNCFYFSAI